LTHEHLFIHFSFISYSTYI